MDEKYLLLFNALTDFIAELDIIRCRLVAVQQAAEEMYISDGSNCERPSHCSGTAKGEAAPGGF